MQSDYQPKQRVVETHPNIGYTPRRGTLVYRNEPYRQWRVRLDNGQTTWWWESDFSMEVP